MTAQPIPYGYCHCGCGRRTGIAEKTDRSRGWQRGEPKRFFGRHRPTRSPVAYVVDADTGCWIWQRALSNRGYGQIRRDGRLHLAHRWYYERARGPIPEGLQLDHLCRNRACVNPDRSAPLTAKELARQFGVHKGTIDSVREGRCWTDVAEQRAEVSEHVLAAANDLLDALDASVGRSEEIVEASDRLDAALIVVGARTSDGCHVVDRLAEKIRAAA